MTPAQRAQILKNVGIDPVANSKNDAAIRIAQSRQKAAEYDKQQEKKKGYFPRVADQFKSGASDIISGVNEAANQMQGGDIVGGVKTSLLRPVGAVAKTSFAPITEAPVIKPALEGLGNLIAKIPGASWVVEQAQKLSETQPELAKDLKNILDIATLGLGGSAEKGIKTGVEKGVVKTGEIVAKGKNLASDVIARGAPVVKSIEDFTQGAKRSVTNLPTKVATNLAEKQAAIQTINKLPTEIAKKTASLGVDVADVNTLLKMPQIIKEPVKKLFQSVKDFSSGVSKVRPEEVVGKPIVQALKNLDSMKQTVGKKLGDVATKLGNVSSEEVFEPVFNNLKKVINGLGIKGKTLDFKNTVLTTAETLSDRKAIQSIFEQAIKGGAGEKLHKLRQELFEILGGKKKSLANITGTQEKAFEAIRKGLSDVLDMKNPLYKKLNTEYAQVSQPLGDLRKMMRGVAGADEDILDMSAGLLARRLTSNAVSNPQLRNILRNIDTILKVKGTTLVNLEGLQDVYNVLDKYYDIAAKTGFKGQIVSSLGEKGTDIISRAWDTATALTKETPAVRQKALEDFLNSILK